MYWLPPLHWVIVPSPLHVSEPELVHGGKHDASDGGTGLVVRSVQLAFRSVLWHDEDRTMAALPDREIA